MNKQRVVLLSILSVLLIGAVAVGLVLFSHGGTTAPAADPSVTLNTPSGFRVEGEALLWDAVPNATGYFVSLDGQNSTFSAPRFDLSTLPAGQHALAVQATGTGSFLPSAVSDTVVLTRLFAPVLTESGRTLRWQPIDGASGYALYADGTLQKTLPLTASSTIVPYKNGTVVYALRALGDGAFVLPSPFSNLITAYHPTSPLGDLSGVTLTDGVLRWEALEHAQSYTVTVKLGTKTLFARTLAADTLSFNMGGQPLGVGVYQVALQAKGRSGYGNSAAVSLPYDVTRLAAPTGLSYQSGVLSWNAVEGATGYAVTIEGRTAMSDTLDATFTSYTLPQTLLPGSYTLSVQALSTTPWRLSSPTSQIAHAEAKWALGTPTVSADDTTLSFTAVDHASGYVLRVQGSGGVVDTRTYGTNDARTYALSNLKTLPAGDYTLSVQALGDESYADSAVVPYENSFTVSTLATPTNLAYSGGVFSWTAVEGATGYAVSLSGRTPLTTTVSAPTTSYTVPSTLLPGAYTLRVQALTATVWQNDSAAASLAHQEAKWALATPVISQTSTALTFGEISHATGYALSLSDGSSVVLSRTLSTSDARSLALSDIGALPLGNYTLSVQALGDEDYAPSATATSNALTVSQLATPTMLTAANLTSSGATLTWGTVSGASGYTVTRSGSATTVTAATHTFSGLTPGASYSATVQAITTDPLVKSSASASVSFTTPKITLATPVPTLSYGVLSWPAVSHATGYVIGGVTLSPSNTITATSLDLYALDLPLGNYTLTVQALGDDNQTIPSATASFAYTELPVRDFVVALHKSLDNLYPNDTDDARYSVQHWGEFSLKRGFTLTQPEGDMTQIYTNYYAFMTQPALRATVAPLIGNDIMITYYYYPGDNTAAAPVPLNTINGAGNPLSKNKLWDHYLHRRIDGKYEMLENDYEENPTAVGNLVPANTTIRFSSLIGNRNPVGSGSAPSSMDLYTIQGLTLYVDLDIIYFDGTAYQLYHLTKSVPVPAYTTPHAN